MNKKLEGENVTLTLVRGVEGNSNVIYWIVIGGGLAWRGQYNFTELPAKPRFGFVFRQGYSDNMRDMYLTDFRYGNMNVKDLPDVPVPDLTIQSKLPPVSRNNTKVILQKKKGKLTKTELDRLIDWALNEPGQWSNHANRALFNHTNLYRVFRVYKETNDIRILEHLVDIANIALESRNDRNKIIGKFKTVTGWKDGRWTYAYEPSWPHFMTWNDQDGEKIYHGDAGEEAVGIHYLSLAARAIAETPAIWNKKVKGSDLSYLELAKGFVNEAIYTVEQSVVPKFIEPETYEAIYQYRRYLPGKSTLDLGGYVPFNRFWHVPVAFVALCPAMEILEIEPEKVKIYDKISQTSIDRWVKSMEHYKKNGLDLIDYPYCYPSKKTYQEDTSKWSFMPDDFNGFPSEDLNHLGCDASQLFIFHFSERYHLPVDILEKFANALLINTFSEGQEYFSYQLNGLGDGKSKTLSAEGYFLTLFQPELKKYFWDNPNQNKELIEHELLFLRLLN